MKPFSNRTLGRTRQQGHAVALLCAVLLLSACGGTSARVVTQPASVAWQGDTLLAPILNVPTMTRAELAAADTLATSLGPDFDPRVAAVVMDTTAPALVRVNAVLLLSTRRARQLDAFSDALAATDERVRAAAVVALRPLMNSWPTGLALVKRALNDPSPLVQSKVLEAIGDSDPDLLRAYTIRAHDPALRKIALDLVQTAEDRGAPLVQSDSTGILERVTPSGHVLRFRPEQRWPHWAAAVGELWLTAPGQPPVSISRGVEVVNTVIPAYVSTDGKHLVYEANRQVHVRELATGADQVIGAGVAPRLLPFTESYVFLRQKEVQPSATGSTLRYDVVRKAFAGESETVLGQVTARALHQEFGHYSPVRWLRVREIDGAFVLSDGIITPFRLPDPFAG